jgi:predicted nucleic acid-binding protein
VTTVTLDSSVIVALCAKEPDKYAQAQSAFAHHQAQYPVFTAPCALVAEVLFVLCKMQEAGQLSTSEHADALDSLEALLQMIRFPSEGDSGLFRRANAIRNAHTCRDCTDGLYIALAEQQSANGPAVLLTFDAGQKRMAEREAPAVTVQLLVPTSTP